METIQNLLRPTEFDDLLLSNKIVRSFKNMYARNVVINMTFYGSTGAGKTSAALIFAGQNRLMFNCPKLTPGEYRAAMAAGSTLTFDGRQRVMIFDEADRLDKVIADQLRGDIEAHRHAAVILTTNHRDKLSLPIRSRCFEVSFEPDVDVADEIINRVSKRIQEKLRRNKMRIDRKKLKEIILQSYPDMRKVANEIDFELLAV